MQPEMQNPTLGTPAIISEDLLHDKIHVVRGREVMLDRDLAEIYGYETKSFNRQVSNNAAKFEGDDFMFRLTEDEYKNLRCNFSTSSWGGARYLPRAFTEQGIYMLMTVLRGDLATRQSRALVRMFKRMKDRIVEGQELLGRREYLQLAMQVASNARDVMDLRSSVDTLEDEVAHVVDSLGNLVTRSELSAVMMDFGNPLVRRGYLLLNGQPCEADLAYSSIYASATTSILLVDNYISLKTLVLLKDVPHGVRVTICSDNIGHQLHAAELEDFMGEYPDVDLSIIASRGTVHDRYIVLDYGTEGERIYHCGGPSKDAGRKRASSIEEISDRAPYKPLFDGLLQNEQLVLR